LLTLSGIKTLFLRIVDDIVESVTVDMGEPIFEDANLFNPTIGKSLAGMGQWSGSALFVSMGNPHYVIFTDNVGQVGETGRILEHHPTFPQRCNIEFAQIVSGGTADHAIIRTRVWERGSGITQACGTGACATAVAAAITGKAGRTSQIVMDGGTLTIEWRESDNHVYMTGPAEFVFDGEIKINEITKETNLNN
jgi:diaminopimelate epimerase